MIALDPNQRVEFTLESYEQRPENERPIFIARHLTCRQWLEYGRHLNAAPDHEDNQEGLAELLAAIRLGLVGWRNVRRGDEPAVFDPDALLDLLTFRELWELAYGILTHTGLAEMALKKSASQSPSAGGASAADPAPGPEKFAPANRDPKPLSG